VFAFALNDDVTAYSAFDVSAALREGGWLVPAYTFPPNRTDLTALRMVVRNGFTHDLADLLIADLKRAIPLLERQAGPRHGSESASFSHGAGHPGKP
jgi:glutamate decarboxylase